MECGKVYLVCVCVIIGGCRHTGIVVYGKEWFFGGDGIQYVSPGGTMMGPPHKVEDLGTTEIPQDLFVEYLKDVKDKFNSLTYDLFNNNCNSFSNELCQFLTSHTIPDYITNLPKEILETPFGAQLQPMLANMRGVTGTPSTQITQPSQPPPPPSPSTQDDREGSIKRIVSYGFTRSEASEELDNCNGDADKALRQLYNKATRF
jgi:hypothetical protein